MALSADDYLEQPDNPPVLSADSFLDAPSEEAEPNLLQQIGSAEKNRIGNIGSAIGKQSTGERTLPETGLSMAANLVGAVSDPIGVTAKNMWGNTPQNIANTIDNTAPAIGDTLMNVTQPISNFAENHPRLAENAENISTLLGLGIAPEAATTALKPANIIGDWAYNSGKASADAAHNSFVQDLVLPKETPKVSAEQFGNSTEEGINQTRTYQPSPYEQEVAQTVAPLPVKSSNSMLTNYNIIRKANYNEANNLIGKLKQNDVAIAPETIQGKFLDIKNNLANSPFITGDGATAADKVINGALYKINANPQTASGLLQARKDFDGWVTNLRGAKTFNPNLDSPVTMAVQQVRQGINDMVDSAVPDAGVKASLRMQSNLYHAMDNIAPKGATEPATRAGRLASKASSLIPDSTAGKIAEGIGAASFIHDPSMIIEHPFLWGTPLVAYGAYKGITAPATRMAVGKALGGGQ